MRILLRSDFFIGPHTLPNSEILEIGGTCLVVAHKLGSPRSRDDNDSELGGGRSSFPAEEITALGKKCNCQVSRIIEELARSLNAFPKPSLCRCCNLDQYSLRYEVLHYRFELQAIDEMFIADSYDLIFTSSAPYCCSLYIN